LFLSILFHNSLKLLQGLSLSASLNSSIAFLRLDALETAFNPLDFNLISGDNRNFVALYRFRQEIFTNTKHTKKVSNASNIPESLEKARPPSGVYISKILHLGMVVVNKIPLSVPPRKIFHKLWQAL